MSSTTLRLLLTLGWTGILIRQGPPPTDRLIMVLDASGSMRGEELLAAKNQLLTILDGVPDSAKAHVVAFNDFVYQWQEDWTDMPDLPAMEDLMDWLASHSGEEGTRLDLALYTVLTLARDNPTACAILITDGEIDLLQTKEVENVLTALVERGIVVHVIAVNPDNEAAFKVVDQISGRTGGSLLVLRKDE